MKVRKLHVTDIRCRTCDAAPDEDCHPVFDPGLGMRLPVHGISNSHGERIAEHAELERAGWQWQEVDPHDANPNRRGVR